MFWFPSERMTTEGGSTRVFERLLSFFFSSIVVFLWIFTYTWVFIYFFILSFGTFAAIFFSTNAGFHSELPNRWTNSFAYLADFDRIVDDYAYLAHKPFINYFLVISIYSIVYAYCSELLYKVLSFLLFIVPFSYAVSAELSNEYLLFCSIFFTLILSYERLASFISKSFDPALDSLRTAVSKKLVLLLEIAAYQEILLNQYTLTIVAFEELTALVADLAISTEAADYTVFSQSLVSSVNESLHTFATAEAQLASQLEFIELSETEAIALDDLINECFDDQVEST